MLLPGNAGPGAQSRTRRHLRHAVNHRPTLAARLAVRSSSSHGGRASSSSSLLTPAMPPKAYVKAEVYPDHRPTVGQSDATGGLALPRFRVENAPRGAETVTVRPFNGTRYTLTPRASAGEKLTVGCIV